MLNGFQFKTKKSTKVVKKTKKTVSKNVACFTAGTKIHTKDGFKNIEAIKMGDYVWSENPETHEKALKKVKKIFVREKDSIVRLSINGESIETTNEHPFYVEGKGWIEAGKLKTGDKTRLEDGSVGIVESTEHKQLETPVTVYNFEVEAFHTYYVSEQKVLVHNTCAVTQKNDIAKKRAKTLQENKKRGAAYEKEKFEEFSKKYSNAESQITIKTASGTRTRVDALGYDEDGTIVIQEFKSSLTASLTKNQRKAFLEIEKSGGVIVGRGKNMFHGGVQIPALEIKVIRP